MNKNEKNTLLILCSLGFVGLGGIHDFYLGRTSSGLIKFFTMNWFMLGTIADILSISNGTYSKASTSSSFSSKNCVACNIKLHALNTSPAKFNNSPLCTDCVTILKSKRVKEGTVYLEDIKRIVNDYYASIPEGYSRDEWFCFDKDIQKSLLLDAQYDDVISAHYANLEKLDMLYSIANNLSDINNESTYKCLELCDKDIALAKNLATYYKKSDHELPYYSAFYYKIKLCEKLGNLDEAIKICKYAIKLGYIRDNSKGGMMSRLLKLLKKAGREDEINEYTKYLK